MGQFLEYIKMAVDNIMSNKGRSILTMLGIIIGISSVITIVSLGNGMKSSVKEQNERNTQPITIEINSENTTNMELLTIEDLNAIENTLSSRIQYAYSTVYGDNAATETRKGKLTITTIFTVPEYNQATSTEETSIFRGKYFTEDDVTNAEPVAIIDKAGALAAFGTTDVVGMELEVTMNSMVQNVRIVGVRDASKEIMESMRMSNEMFGMGLSIQLEMPYTTAASFAKPINGFSSIMVKPQADQDKSAVTKIVLDLLQKRDRKSVV